MKTDTETPASRDLSVYVPEKVRKPGEVVFALLGTFFGVFGYCFALEMTSDSYSAPSVFPKTASVLIIACGAVSLVKALRREKAPSGEATLFGFLLPRDVLFVLGMLVVYCLALPYLHFIASSYLFMVAGMIWLRRGEKIFQSLIVSAATLAILVAVFRYVFLVILP
jgi:putative tricarboxylic transport membrane protein